MTWEFVKFLPVHGATDKHLESNRIEEDAALPCYGVDGTTAPNHGGAARYELAVVHASAQRLSG